MILIGTNALSFNFRSNKLPRVKLTSTNYFISTEVKLKDFIKVNYKFISQVSVFLKNKEEGKIIIKFIDGTKAVVSLAKSSDILIYQYLINYRSLTKFIFNAQVLVADLTILYVLTKVKLYRNQKLWGVNIKNYLLLNNLINKIKLTEQRLKELKAILQVKTWESQIPNKKITMPNYYASSSIMETCMGITITKFGYINLINNYKYILKLMCMYSINNTNRINVIDEYHNLLNYQSLNKLKN